MQPTPSLYCTRCGAAVDGDVAFCVQCGLRLGTTVGSKVPRGPERIVSQFRAIAYRGWFDSLRMSVPFAGSPGMLALTSRRLVFAKGLIHGDYRDITGLDAGIARHGGLSFALAEIAEASARGKPSVAIGGAEELFAIRVAAPKGGEAHTFAIQSLTAALFGLDLWVLMINEAKKTGGEIRQA